MIENWNNKVIELFADFSDEDLQRRSWFGIGPEVSSPIEMCNWADDILLEEWIVENESKLDLHLKNFIQDFLLDLDKLAALPDDWKVFSSPEWIATRLNASVIRDLLNKQFSKPTHI